MRPPFRLVPDFIIPHLNNRTYGSHLLWEDKKKGSFKISRIHQSSEMWNEQCIEVYKAWSLKKKHWNSLDPKRITKAKHRLITALRRSPEIEMLKKESSFYRFRIIQPEISDPNLDKELNQENSRNYQPTISTKYKHEMNRHLEPADNTENCFTEKLATEDKEQNNNLVFNSYEPNTNLIQWPYTQSEIYDAQKEMPTPDYNFTDEAGFIEVKTSDKCCCKKLLDSYLCDQQCIWHGIPP